MSKPIKQKTEQVLDTGTLELLGGALQPLNVPAESLKKLKSSIMDQVDAEEKAARPSLVTIHSSEGNWEQIAPKIHKKVLRLDLDTGAEAYLLRAEPGAEAPPHDHDLDEYCLVLEGEVDFDDLHLQAGDYHFAAKGSRHSAARTQTGALLYIQTALAA